MNIRYLYVLIFAGAGAYFLYKGSYLEGSLYLVAGLAFLFNTLAGEPRLAFRKRELVVITWVLIIASGLLFLYLLPNYI